MNPLATKLWQYSHPDAHRLRLFDNISRCTAYSVAQSHDALQSLLVKKILDLYLSTAKLGLVISPLTPRHQRTKTLLVVQ
jgi:hypothetical protein